MIQRYRAPRQGRTLAPGPAPLAPGHAAHQDRAARARPHRSRQTVPLALVPDEQCKTQALSDDERLAIHQRDSAPVMAKLQQWIIAQFHEKRVEPNSGLGEAFQYLLKRWGKLTLFLRVSGAPLDNSFCERVLKLAIRHRNNSLFYRSVRGARVGDIYMA
jgi:hypothetical protein